MTSTIYKGHEIEVDQDGHITVWQLDDNGIPDGDHWTEPSVAAAKQCIEEGTPGYWERRLLRGLGIKVKR
tara:strand:- start:2219 stop:2428 length:210 start_codon:yes stop_codon:yes gene_type:complete